MITRASARKGFSLLELIVVLVVLGLLAAIAIPTYQALIGKTQDKTAIATAESVARNAIALAAFDQVGPVTDPAAGADTLTTKKDGSTSPTSTYLGDAAAEVEGDDITPVVDPGTANDGKVCVNLNNVGAEDAHVAVTFDAGLNAGFSAVTVEDATDTTPCDLTD